LCARRLHGWAPRVGERPAARERPSAEPRANDLRPDRVPDRARSSRCASILSVAGIASMLCDRSRRPTAGGQNRPREEVGSAVLITLGYNGGAPRTAPIELEATGASAVEFAPPLLRATPRPRTPPLPSCTPHKKRYPSLRRRPQELGRGQPPSGSCAFERRPPLAPRPRRRESRSRRASSSMRPRPDTLAAASHRTGRLPTPALGDPSRASPGAGVARPGCAT